MELDEKIFNSYVDLPYVYRPGQNSEFLIVIFSGYATLGAQYHWIKITEPINEHRLNILDNQGHKNLGTWYIGTEGTFNVTKSVIELIEDIRMKNNIKKENVICLGTSKGGFAALYYTIKCGYGYCIAGTPQIFMFSYLQNYFTDILLSITGTLDDEINKELNYLIDTTFIQPYQKIIVSTGDEENVTPRHIYKAFKNYNFDKKNVKIDIYPGLHKDVVEYFLNHLTDYLDQILNHKEIGYSSNEDFNHFVELFNSKLKYFKE